MFVFYTLPSTKHLLSLSFHHLTKNKKGPRRHSSQLYLQRQGPRWWLVQRRSRKLQNWLRRALVYQWLWPRDVLLLLVSISAHFSPWIVVKWVSYSIFDISVITLCRDKKNCGITSDWCNASEENCRVCDGTPLYKWRSWRAQGSSWKRTKGKSWNAMCCNITFGSK